MPNLNGVETTKIIKKKYPNIKIITTAVDPKLDHKKYLTPGLGDYGDRYYGTQE